MLRLILYVPTHLGIVAHKAHLYIAAAFSQEDSALNPKTSQGIHLDSNSPDTNPTEHSQDAVEQTPRPVWPKGSVVTVPQDTPGFPCPGLHNNRQVLLIYRLVCQNSES